MYRYHFETVIDGKPHWWVSRAIQESTEPSWVTDVREATVYANERNARCAAGQLMRWHGHKFPGLQFSVVCYYLGAFKGDKPIKIAERSDFYRYGIG